MLSDENCFIVNYLKDLHLCIRVNRPNKIKINGYAVLNLNFNALFKPKDSKLDFYWYVFMCCWYFMALIMW